LSDFSFRSFGKTSTIVFINYSPAYIYKQIQYQVKILKLIAAIAFICLLSSCTKVDDMKLNYPFSNGTKERNLIVVISDIHLGADLSYAECNKNLRSLELFLNEVKWSRNVKELVIAGDMLQGSLIDSEWKGLSTIEIMNWLAPDVVTLGNHEIDYGLPHLLFLEKIANFPIVNANLYIKKNYKRLMNPYLIIKKAGFDILFTGIITEKISQNTVEYARTVKDIEELR